MVHIAKYRESPSRAHYETATWQTSQAMVHIANPHHEPITRAWRSRQEEESNLVGESRFCKV